MQPQVCVHEVQAEEYFYHARTKLRSVCTMSCLSINIYPIRCIGTHIVPIDKAMLISDALSSITASITGPANCSSACGPELKPMRLSYKVNRLLELSDTAARHHRPRTSLTHVTACSECTKDRTITLGPGDV